MEKPKYIGRTDQDAIDRAAAQGLPEIDGKQALASSRVQKAGGAPVTWYAFADGTETVRDDNGNPAKWPE